MLLALVIGVLLTAGSASAAPGSTGDGTRSLYVSNATTLNVNGDVVTVSGSGYDMEKGIYVALCVMTAPGVIPSPCGGGVDTAGTSGSSAWISSNAGSVGEGLAIPYGAGGSFTVTLNVGPVVNSAIDCRVVQCAIATRNDHTRRDDRSQDLKVPITFVQPVVPTAVPPTQANQPSQPTVPPPPTATLTPTITPIPATPTPTPPPSTSLSSDGRTGTVGSRSLTLANAEGLDPKGQEIEITGEGFDEAVGVYVSLCAVPSSASVAPGPCAAGSADASAWISSNPPSYAANLAKPYGTGGSFEVTLVPRPVIDAQTDCRKVACAIVARADDTATDKRAQEVVVPVTFAASSGEVAEPTSEPAEVPDASGSADGPGSGATPWLIGTGILALLAFGGLGIFVWRSRRGAVLTGLLGLLLLGACSSGDAATPSLPGDHGADVGIVTVDGDAAPDLPVTVTDADGREVTISDATRIVPLWGNLTEIVFGLGLGDRVVGRDVTATFEDADGLPIVTRAHEVSAESVLSLEPTLVLASEDTGPDTALTHIRNVGVPVVVFDEPTSIDEIVPRIRAIAAALGVPAAGEELVARTEAEFESARGGIPAGATHPRVAFLYMRGQA
ncbi:MAG: heme/hemin ABC transporter substrate-binding protein, partial [Tepidiformaceae bacterium]